MHREEFLKRGSLSIYANGRDSTPFTEIWGTTVDESVPLYWNMRNYCSYWRVIHNTENGKFDHDLILKSCSPSSSWTLWGSTEDISIVRVFFFRKRFWYKKGTLLVMSQYLLCLLFVVLFIVVCWLQERWAWSNLFLFRHVNRLVLWCSREVSCHWQFYGEGQGATAPRNFLGPCTGPLPF